ncbi:MAG TPA: sulfatase-like hydrolase/transferase [Clostridia bacterium]|nr:sulfatase-like hydrolase/transferase [Clostridia bacterium]
MEKTLSMNYASVPYRSPNVKTSIVTALPLICFAFFNVLKITLIDFHMMQSQTPANFLYKFIFTLLISSVCLFIFRFRKPYLFILAYLLQAVYMFVNLAYYLYFHSNLHIFHSAVLLTEGARAAGQLAIPASPWFFALALDFPAFLYLLFNCSKIAELSSRIRLKRNLFIIGCITVLFVFEGINYFSGYSLVQFSKNYAVSEPLIVERYGTLANSLVDLVVNNTDSVLAGQLKYGKAIMSAGQNTAKPNFVIIQVESMDASAVNQKHNGKYVMPFLHSLAQKNVYYPYTMSYHKAGATSDSEFSTIDSLEPLDNYPAMKISNYNYPNSMIKVLDDNGYSTAAFHGNVAAYFNRDHAYPKMGFQNFYDMKRMGLHDVVWGAPDKDVFNYNLKTLGSMKQPFLSYTITMSSHGNFTLVNGFYDNKAYDDVKDKEIRDYLNSMSYVDKQLKSYVTKIQSEFKNTYIFIWGDHTPGVGNNINTFKMSSMTYDKKYFEFVPMIIVTPDQKNYQENKKVASFLDVAPTLLNASGLPYSYRSDGMNLLDPNAQLDPIPYKGGTYDRELLYKKILETRK